QLRRFLPIPLSNSEEMSHRDATNCPGARTRFALDEQCMLSLWRRTDANGAALDLADHLVDVAGAAASLRSASGARTGHATCDTYRRQSASQRDRQR
ncbi:MAG TPA: hypothetical protein VFG86_06995, partial [Chloroflexota bacterium]|nr:hypothetical protein [Chloroflexota bacterium]